LYGFWKHVGVARGIPGVVGCLMASCPVGTCLLYAAHRVVVKGKPGRDKMFVCALSSLGRVWMPMVGNCTVTTAYRTSLQDILGIHTSIDELL
jgi:hypothetical protein